ARTFVILAVPACPREEPRTKSLGGMRAPRRSRWDGRFGNSSSRPRGGFWPVELAVDDDPSAWDRVFADGQLPQRDAALVAPHATPGADRHPPPPPLRHGDGQHGLAVDQGTPARADARVEGLVRSRTPKDRGPIIVNLGTGSRRVLSPDHRQSALTKSPLIA